MHDTKSSGRVELKLHSFLTIGGAFHRPTALLLAGNALLFIEDEKDP
jgi:hypothetical protein